MVNPEPNEPILPADYPIYSGYWYIADGKPVQSDYHNISADRFKRLIGATELRRCDAVARGLL